MLANEKHLPLGDEARGLSSVSFRELTRSGTWLHHVAELFLIWNH